MDDYERHCRERGLFTRSWSISGPLMLGLMAILVFTEAEREALTP